MSKTSVDVDVYNALLMACRNAEGALGLDPYNEDRDMVIQRQEQAQEEIRRALRLWKRWQDSRS